MAARSNVLDFLNLPRRGTTHLPHEIYSGDEEAVRAGLESLGNYVGYEAQWATSPSITFVRSTGLSRSLHSSFMLASQWSSERVTSAVSGALVLKDTLDHIGTNLLSWAHSVAPLTEIVSFRTRRL